MDKDQIRKILEDAGIPVTGDWQPTQKLTGVQSPILQRQKDALQKLEGLLQQQLEQDQQKMADLHVALQKIKHGGGIVNG